MVSTDESRWQETQPYLLKITWKVNLMCTRTSEKAAFINNETKTDTKLILHMTSIHKIFV